MPPNGPTGRFHGVPARRAAAGGPCRAALAAHAPGAPAAHAPLHLPPKAQKLHATHAPKSTPSPCVPGAAQGPPGASPAWASATGIGRCMLGTSQSTPHTRTNPADSRPGGKGVPSTLGAGLGERGCLQPDLVVHPGQSPVALPGAGGLSPLDRLPPVLTSKDVSYSIILYQRQTGSSC
jgi:hypothetical protein